MNVVTHPFGPPMQASLYRDGGQLVLTWTAAEDDWVVVGELSGAFAERAADETGEQALAGSHRVQDYLAPHLVLSQGGQDCTREWLPTRDLLGEGVRASFICPDPHAPVDVRVDVLTDVNEAYRTVLRTEDTEVLFTATAPDHEVATENLGDGGTTGSEIGVVVVAALLVVVVAVVVCIAMARGNRRQARTQPDLGGRRGRRDDTQLTAIPSAVKEQAR